MGGRRLQALPAVQVLVAGCAAGLVALAFDLAPLLVAALALVLLALATPAWVWVAARGGSVRRSLRVARAVEDEPIEATVEVRRGPIGIPGAVVRDPFSGASIDLADALAAIRGERRATVRVRASFQRRGRYRLAPPQLSVGDPLGLARAVVTGSGGSQDLLVLPRTEPVRWRVGAGEVRRMLSGDGSAAGDRLAAVDPDGLRAYRPGTPASRIHWPAVARGAGLMERRLRAHGDARPLVALDLRTPGRDEQDEVDAAVRAAASLVLALARDGCALLLGGEQRPTAIDGTLAAWPGACTRLALARGGPTAPAPALAPSIRRGATIYVAAALWPRVVATVRARAGGPVLLVVPESRLQDALGERAGAPLREALSVCGCRGFVVGPAARGHGPQDRSRQTAAGQGKMTNAR
ncbi:MAG TPA: DUF58 domain-containing protein [Solirubrobacteraceae bacterium]|nr:DUF58 domain-containing protein [Solirubrobacteraceae bacterium]